MRAATYVPKGGVGKTTSTGHIAVSAVNHHDLEVVALDLAGTQNDLATQFGIADEVDDPDAPISAVFGENWSFIRDNIDDIVDRMVFETDEGVDIIPADEGLGGADNNLANVPREDRYGKLDAFITDELAPRYDLVLLDLPGKEDNITINGLFAAENVVAPLKPGEFERNQAKNLETELEAIRDDADHDASPQLQLVFATMIEKGTNLSGEFEAELEKAYPDVAGPSVTKAQDIGNEQARGRTLFALEDDELYATGKRARDSYRKLTNDLLDRLEAR
ncbi:ParA family protein [Natronosalvus halobius]|uniref:ParA family protein n=1 Tax=Natronosalvus halobius TaxID=2953746 RepID=UPI00209D41F7|nr:ParA family protein [Natronosalvus halobius]USZ73761.1 ParA family protein [Natronosalvus halobius]